ncbi:excalibur calcium-binding domain-containing protein [Streptomyces sp. JJ36]|uniref:excalibur calcium-binding domain-containing protein n=1 Tax=Streptomyces sp. JJ36 TaxID=2736645 RepID=UPI001F48869E|nr:excalibur calcium-binding domain-containing protein [Streptomyces sp. JJ36]MCF6521732.1 excalibur calcium-binding domain-containing protein [Streptomyces sp. JJ36]
MNLLRKPAAVTVAALALAAMPSVAAAHEGEGHPFENCTAAYEAGYADIEAGSEHYGKHLDRDGDGLGCDQPPSDFTPAEDQGTTDDAASDDGAAQDGSAGAQDDTALAETGGDDTTPYLAGAGAVVLLGGAGVLLAVRRRRAGN